MRYSLLPVLLLAATPVLAAPDPVAADACAAKLEPEAKAIYVAAAPSIKQGEEMRAVLTRVVMPKVMSGVMTRRAARPLAESASRCLGLMQ